MSEDNTILFPLLSEQVEICFKKKSKKCFIIISKSDQKQHVSLFNY